MQLGHVFLEVPQRHNGLLAILNLVDKQECLSGNNGCAMHGSNLRHDTLHVEVLMEQNLIVRLLLQINFDEVFELFTQMPDGCRFPYLSGTSKQHGFMSGTCCPFTKILIYDSFVIHLRYEFSRCKDTKKK